MANGGQARQQQASVSNSSSSSYDLRETASRQLNKQQIPFYKYLNSGTTPNQVNNNSESEDNSNRIKDDQSEREIDSQINPETNLVSQSLVIDQSNLPRKSNSQIIQLNIEESNIVNPAGLLKFPEGPPTRSPLPSDWASNESINSGGLFKTYSIPEGILPVESPQRECIKVIIENPSARKCKSAPVSPTSRRNSVSEHIFPSRKLRSPFLGISSLASSTRQPSEASLDWDGYSNTPSFYTRPSPIPVVSTPSTSIDSTPLSSLPATPVNTTPINTAIMPVPESLASDILALQVSQKVVENLISMFPPDHMTADRLPIYYDELKEIRNKFLEFSTLLLTLSVKHAAHIEHMPMTQSGERMSINWWQSQEQNLFQRVTNHQLQVRQAASKIQAETSGMSDFQKKDIELKERQLAIMEENKKRGEDNEKAKANAIGQSKYDEVIAYGAELEEHLKHVEDWSTATRSEVVTAMKSLDKWAVIYNNLNKAHREFTLATSTFPLDDLATQVQITMDGLIQLYTDVTKAVREEDQKRELYSLAGSAAESVKLPKFSGSVGEDFATFKSKLLLALEKNRVAAADKVEKLRSCLSGQALSLVPEKTKEFDTALQVLAEAYGNAEKLLAVKVNELKKLGKCPPETINGKLNYQSIVSFCLKVEVLVQDLIDLAESDDNEQLKFDVYSSGVRTNIQNLFGLREIMKMRCLTGRGKLGLQEHITYVKEFRAKAQNMIDPADVKEKSARKNDSRNIDTDSSTKSSHSMFKSPRRYDNCRVCGVLETEGESGLYVDHLSESIIGCPKFQAMSADQRRTISLKAKMCIKCCDKDIIFNMQHGRSCKVNRSNKLSITCAKFPQCTTHSWICTQHKDANRGKIQDLSRKLKISPPVNTNLSVCPESDVATSKCSTEEAIPIEAVTTNSVKPTEVAKIIKNMRRNAKKRGAELHDIPDGNSMFILAALKGKTEPVLTFLDSGCSDAVFRHDIPGNQLAGVCINEGPITCTGVGNIQLNARQEWIVKFKKKNGNVQLVKGLSLDTVCAPMPTVNTIHAVTDLKKSDPSNSILQNCCVPAVIGGDVGVILGIRYNNIGPKAIHSLESGLTIYSINLETHWWPSLFAICHAISEWWCRKSITNFKDITHAVGIIQVVRTTKYSTYSIY